MQDGPCSVPRLSHILNSTPFQPQPDFKSDPKPIPPVKSGRNPAYSSVLSLIPAPTLYS